MGKSAPTGATPAEAGTSARPLGKPDEAHKRQENRDRMEHFGAFVDGWDGGFFA